MTNFENKLVGILNKDLEMGIALNALAHLSVGLGGSLKDPSLLRLDTYTDADKNSYESISQLPFIILRARSIDIEKTIKAAKENNIAHTAFLNTMTGETYREQLERTAATPSKDLIYYGCVLFGPWEMITTLTKKFSLWK